MTALQLDLLATADPTRDAVLRLIAGDAIHQRGRAAIVDAFRQAVRSDGTVSINDARPLIPAWVAPHLIGAVVHALTKADVLVWTGEWEMSTDTRGRNGSKPVRRHLWREPLADASNVIPLRAERAS